MFLVILPSPFSYKSTTPAIRVQTTRPHLTSPPKSMISQAITLSVDLTWEYVEWGHAPRVSNSPIPSK